MILIISKAKEAIRTMQEWAIFFMFFNVKGE